jgi:hypothetical protein
MLIQQKYGAQPAKVNTYPPGHRNESAVLQRITSTTYYDDLISYENYSVQIRKERNAKISLQNHSLLMHFGILSTHLYVMGFVD